MYRHFGNDGDMFNMWNKNKHLKKLFKKALHLKLTKKLCTATKKKIYLKTGLKLLVSPLV